LNNDIATVVGGFTVAGVCPRYVHWMLSGLANGKEAPDTGETTAMDP